ncbi:uncharacterized protein [Manis javanica]|uniref:uncharacterized protein isoform X2 n=1 Tax=Manis javanica TaxID=9974 RepID=UPI003C6D8901
MTLQLHLLQALVQDKKNPSIILGGSSGITLQHHGPRCQPPQGLPESRRWACALSLQCPLAVCLATHVLDKCVRTEQQERTKQRTLSWLRRSPQSRPVPTSGLPTSNSKINAHRGARQDVASRLLTPRLPAPAALPGAGQERNCRSQSPAHAVTSPGRLEGHPQRAALARFTGR